MTIVLDSNQVEVVVGGLMAGIDVDDGPTSEQVSVLRALATHLWRRPDLDLATVRRLGPSELAERISHPQQRQVFHELHMTLETCRHPQSPAQVQAVADYATALEIDGDDLIMFGDLVTEGVEAAAADYQRFLAADLRERFEPSLRRMVVHADEAEPELAAKLGAFAEYGPGSLGWAYLGFYERFGLSVPGAEASAINHFFVAHDMTHTITGISTTVAGEIALSAFQFAMNDTRVNRAALLASLVAHEAGFAHADHLKSADNGVLAGAEASLLLAQELARGSACTADFSLVDHFELAPFPLADVRAEFGVRSPENPRDGHHFW